MDQIKTGKLIAKLRKEKGMTQQQLADIVGINYRSVSKWETGQTMPDIANIDLLGQIFGVTSDEILKGKLNSDKTKSKKKYFLLLIPIIIIAVVIGIIIYRNNESETYSLHSSHENDYYVEGKVIINNKDIIILINKIWFRDKDFNKINIKEYSYQLILNDAVLYGYGISKGKKLDQILTIKELLDNFNMSCNDKMKFDKTVYLNNNLILKLMLIDENNQEINVDIVMDIVPKNDN